MEEKSDELESLVKEMTKMIKEQRLEITNMKTVSQQRYSQYEDMIKKLNEELDVGRALLKEAQSDLEKASKEKQEIQEQLDRHGNNIREFDSMKKKNTHLVRVV